MEVVAPPTPAETYELGFIGAGKMAESIARGWIRAAAHTNPSRGAAFESLGVQVLSDCQAVVEDGDVVIFSVKPQVVKGVVSQLRPLLSKKQLLVSVFARVKLKDLLVFVPIISRGGAVKEEDAELIAILIGSIGKMWKADEKYFDAITGLSVVRFQFDLEFSIFCVYAMAVAQHVYIFLAIEALADGGVAAGLPRDLVLGLASQTVSGAASMASKMGKHPGQLKDNGGFRGILMNAVIVAAKRGSELPPS
ncbi:hypothetical protein ACJRO7_007451 [Eucalyptus globulus]|uniref:Pyrroline-5-carboxylate reductase n=1 Tax=Eucalyptus globulus TaxID=34317 RepID=A0ABD3IMI2_EUCGL